jgi:hypothetical protein
MESFGCWVNRREWRVTLRVSFQGVDEEKAMCIYIWCNYTVVATALVTIAC